MTTMISKLQSNLRRHLTFRPQLVRHLIAASMASLAMRAAGMASTFLLGVVLARVLGPGEYGIYGLVISLGALGTNFALLGIPQLAVREMAVLCARGQMQQVRVLIHTFNRATAIASLATGALMVGGALIAGGSDHMKLAIWTIGALLCGTLTRLSLQAAALRGVGALSRGQFMDLCGRPCAVLAICGLCLWLHQPLSAKVALAMQLAVAIMAALISGHWLRQATALDHSFGSRNVGQGTTVGLSNARFDIVKNRWWRASFPLGLVDVMRQFDGTYGLILISSIALAADVGVYRVALACMALIAMPTNIAHIVMAPSISRLYANEEFGALQKLLSSVSLGISGILLIMLTALIVIGKYAVVLIFGAAYANAWLPLVLLCFGQLLYSLFGMGPILLAMCGDERALTGIYAVALSMGILAALVLSHYFGIIGVAGGQIVSGLLTGALSDARARVRLGLATAFFTSAKLPTVA